jgi:hypothetical protein
MNYLVITKQSTKVEQVIRNEIHAQRQQDVIVNSIEDYKLHTQSADSFGHAETLVLRKINELGLKEKIVQILLAE